jgi:hypothetical protein
MQAGDDMQEQLKKRDPEFGLKIAVVAFLCTLGGGALSFVWERLGWFVMAISMFGGFIGIGLHWRSNWRRILRIDD